MYIVIKCSLSYAKSIVKNCHSIEFETIKEHTSVSQIKD